MVPNANENTECGTVVIRHDRYVDSITYVRHHARARATARLTMLLLPGGPGLASSDYLELALAIVGPLADSINILLVDHWGTGLSGGDRCQNGFKGDERYVADSVQSCLSRIQLNLARLESNAAVENIETVRTTLGISPLLLYGLSDGGRLALLYSARYPGSIRRIILHSPVTLEPWLVQVPQATEIAFVAVQAACRATPTCSTHNLADIRDSVLKQLTLRPLEIASVNTGNEVFELTARGFSNLLRESLYEPSNPTSTLNLLLAAQSQNRATLGRLIQQVQALDRNQSFGAKLAALCGEDVPSASGVLGLNHVARAAQHWSWSEVLLVESFAACEKWPPRPPSRHYLSPIDVPLLAFTGEFDLVTPPVLMRNLIPTTTQPFLFVIKGEGHGSLWNCMIAPIRAFLVGAETVRPACAENLIDWFARKGWARN